jgi:hypothetical protein
MKEAIPCPGSRHYRKKSKALKAVPLFGKKQGHKY